MFRFNKRMTCKFCAHKIAWSHTAANVSGVDVCVLCVMWISWQFSLTKQSLKLLATFGTIDTQWKKYFVQINFRMSFWCVHLAFSVISWVSKCHLQNPEKPLKTFDPQKKKDKKQPSSFLLYAANWQNYSKITNKFHSKRLHIVHVEHLIGRLLCKMICPLGSWNWNECVFTHDE